MYATVETARTAHEDVERAMRAVLGSLASWAKTTLGDGFLDKKTLMVGRLPAPKA